MPSAHITGMSAPLPWIQKAGANAGFYGPALTTASSVFLEVLLNIITVTISDIVCGCFLQQ